MTRRELLWMTIAGLTMIGGGCGPNDPKLKSHKVRTRPRKPLVDRARRAMVEKIKKGFEAEQTKKVKEQYGSTLGAATRHRRRSVPKR
jgi:hypothetical protein